MTVGRVRISEYGDLARRSSLSRREVDAVVRTLNGSDSPALVVEEWLTDEKAIMPVEGEERVYRVSVLDETAKAWLVATGDETSWVPKSQSTLFELANGVDVVSTPATTLSEFGSGSA